MFPAARVLVGPYLADVIVENPMLAGDGDIAIPRPLAFPLRLTEGWTG